MLSTTYKCIGNISSLNISVYIVSNIALKCLGNISLWWCDIYKHTSMFVMFEKRYGKMTYIQSKGVGFYQLCYMWANSIGLFYWNTIDPCYEIDHSNSVYKWKEQSLLNDKRKPNRPKVSCKLNHYRYMLRRCLYIPCYMHMYMSPQCWYKCHSHTHLV